MYKKIRIPDQLERLGLVLRALGLNTTKSFQLPHFSILSALCMPVETMSRYSLPCSQVNDLLITQKTMGNP